MAILHFVSEAFLLYGGFLFVEGLFAFYMPGLDVNGRPDETGRVLKYRCNAYLSWWTTLAALAFLHWSEIFPLQRIFQLAGPIMSVAVIFADSLSLVLYLHAHSSGSTFRMLYEAYCLTSQTSHLKQRQPYL